MTSQSSLKRKVTTVPGLRKEKTRKKKKDFQQKLVRRKKKRSPQKLGVRKKKKVPGGQKLGVRKTNIFFSDFFVFNFSENARSQLGQKVAIFKAN